ncbi:putative L-type lectin-domain containing receptor kinase VII.1-like isoform 1 [Capsicum annuum]|nr:putative L-type lectin-domain containing receptor kinase VII.1-like isoform 1 [Capsicum annuum]
MFKEKEGRVPGIHIFAPRKKVGMLLLCAVSIAVCLWVFFVDKGENAQELNPSLSNRLFNPEAGQKDNSTNIESVERTNVGQSASTVQPPPPPPVYFKGYTLPPGNPCEGFTLPPPPADKKRTGPRPCPVCYLPIEQAIALMPDAPSSSPGVSNLTYIREENSGKPEFGGYPSLMQRNDSYEIRESMSVHCGFVKGIRPGHQTDFDIDDSDLHDMEFCRGVVVASAIFGAFDLIREPKNISDYSKKNVCFHMFVDEQTEVFVPKLLLHRLFPNARYSLGIDAKLELVVDPYQILERFLWRKNASFAISRHYRRFDVFVEAEANKASGKFDNASISF